MQGYISLLNQGVLAIEGYNCECDLVGRVVDLSIGRGVTVVKGRGSSSKISYERSK